MTNQPNKLATNTTDDLRSLSTQFNRPESLEGWMSKDKNTILATSNS
ncbi:MAG: hypothetical protein QNJ53_30500 [Pleurocapsa sp. MO_192.B19]|nr:hypothetical protein [Pleurocapsa sp. MO_192.B19]